MSQSNVDTNTENLALARELLKSIAQRPNLETLVPYSLEVVMTRLNAQASFFVLTEEPLAVFCAGMSEEDLPEEEWLKAYLMSAPQKPIYDAPSTNLEGRYAQWLAVPVVIKQKTVGGVFLLFPQATQLDESQQECLALVLDALLIVTETFRSNARNEKLLRNQAEFVRILSHDLRTPLTSILGFASMMASGSMGELNEKQNYFTEKIMSGVAQMTSLVDNIQDAGRYDPETGFYQMERSPLDLNELAQKIVRNQLVPAEKMDLTLSYHADPDVPIIYADQRMIERSLINLVDNAIKYTPNGGRIDVSVAHTAEELTISVRDDGLGISPENMRQLFQRHFRIRRPEHKKVKGSGLGLFIVRSVARQHGGEAFVESIEGQGSVFGLRIPLSGANLLGGSDS